MNHKQFTQHKLNRLWQKELAVRIMFEHVRHVPAHRDLLILDLGRLREKRQKLQKELEAS